MSLTVFILQASPGHTAVNLPRIELVFDRAFFTQFQGSGPLSAYWRFKSHPAAIVLVSLELVDAKYGKD